MKATYILCLLLVILVPERNIAVEVETAPEVSVPFPRIGLTLKLNANLNCHVKSYPSPSITWEKDGKTLSTNKHYQISNFSGDDEEIDTILRINNVEKEDYGKYVCKVENKLGVAKGTIELFEEV